ncbi:MAG: tRNA (adenosine(37)-N6)-dimethylallyltransferase MiaA [Chlamydiia bacterium]|nr:tRNA (adenosine(37)-N6)-dimethylallyltransferase MiaA [Chlamydiia bacterium]
MSTQQETIEKVFFGLAVQAQQQVPSALIKKKKKVIILAGPTASGKTDLSIMLAQAIGGEIISADSMQVYRGMDIGTAKPSREMLDLIPHHLIDIRDITEPFNVVDFYYEARQCCLKVLDRGGIPIVVGGSGFYLHSLIYGPPSGPPSVPEVRIRIEDEMEKYGHELLFERLEKIDPQYARTITKNDKQKIIRALEIIALTGGKVSDLSWSEQKKIQGFDFRCWFVHRPRETLYQRIEDRCERMLESGLLDEVKKLDAMGIRENHSIMQAIGYRQTMAYLDSPQTDADYKKMVEEFKKASRHYAKRQFTWFRKEPLFGWIDLDLHDPEVILDIIAQDYER